MQGIATFSTPNGKIYRCGPGADACADIVVRVLSTVVLLYTLHLPLPSLPIFRLHPIALTLCLPFLLTFSLFYPRPFTSPYFSTASSTTLNATFSSHACTHTAHTPISKWACLSTHRIRCASRPLPPFLLLTQCRMDQDVTGMWDVVVLAAMLYQLLYRHTAHSPLPPPPIRGDPPVVVYH
jgi:hypothetical protein